MESIRDMVEASQRLDERKIDLTAAARDVRFYEGDCSMLVPCDLFNGSRTALIMEDLALQQVCDRLGPPPSRYMRACPPRLRARNLNHWAAQVEPTKRWLVRGWELGDDVAGPQLSARGVLSDQYVPLTSNGDFGNTTVLKIAEEMLTGQAHSWARPHVDRDALHACVTYVTREQKPGDPYAVGVYLGNGEVGNRALRVSPFIQRIACTNSIIHQAGGVRIIHRNVSIQWIRATIKGKLGRVFGASIELFEKVMEAEVHAIDDVADVVSSLCAQHGWSDAVRDNILIGTEGDESRMGVVNGVSFAAWATKGNDVESRVDMESVAGAILADRDSLFGSAARRLAESQVLDVQDGRRLM